MLSIYLLFISVRIADVHVQSDPCFAYTNISDPTLQSDYVDIGTTANWKFPLGWYRYIGPGNGVLLTECPKAHQCGSDHQAWLSDSVPLEYGLTKEIQICITDGECCRHKNKLSTKRCAQGFYVYFLAPFPPSLNKTRYCFSSNTTTYPDPSTTTKITSTQTPPSTTQPITTTTTQTTHPPRPTTTLPATTISTSIPKTTRQTLTTRALTSASIVMAIPTKPSTRAEPDACDSNPCRNGRCFSSRNEFICICSSGFIGTLCDINIDDCGGNQCVNGASCVDGVNNYTCACVPGFTGQYCQLDIQECASHPCQNGGKCTDKINDFTCQCPENYTGKFCESEKDACAFQPCLHNGICTNYITSYACDCPVGFFGQRCEFTGPKCFSCTGVSSLLHCTTISTCANDEVCFVERYQDAQNNSRFNYGCRHINECVRPNAIGCIDCCHGDLCNDHGCLANGIPPRHMRGPLCYHCSDMTDMNFCKSISVCDKEEVCTVYGNDFSNYDGKCYNRNNPCNLMSMTPDNTSVVFCDYCCSDDFCNNDCSKVQGFAPGPVLVG